MALQPIIRISSEQRFGCSSCGNCCRRWHVAVNTEEITGLRNRNWRGDSYVAEKHDPITMIDGQAYLAHKPNGDCIYLDPDTTLCRLEVRFGHAAKPLGCRLFPYHLTRVLPKVVSCSARFDCPSVQQNKGPLLSDQQGQVATLVSEMKLAEEVDEKSLAGLQPDTVILFAESFARIFDASVEKNSSAASLALLLTAEHFAGLGTDFLNDCATMREILPTLLTKFCHQAGAQLLQAKSIGSLDRMLFRLWLSNYLRRDEEIIGQRGRRGVRMLDSVAILCGGGNFRRLGAEHPDVSLRRMQLFVGRDVEPSPDVYDSWRRFVQGRLRTLQFFGAALDGEDFFAGAKRLAVIFGLVSGAAKINAAAAGRANQLEAADVEYAVGAIDHSFGHSTLLRLLPQRFLETHFLDPDRYARVLFSLNSVSVR